MLLGPGRFAVADWWLWKVVAVLGVTAVAETPATTTERAKTRMANFMVWLLLRIWIDRKSGFLRTKTVRGNYT
jgi:hypothetical protein